MNSCTHPEPSTSTSGVFQYCERCGAVRLRIPEKPGQWQPWHICDLCRLRIEAHG